MTAIVNSHVYWPLRTPVWTLFGISGSTAVDRTFDTTALMNDASDDAHFVGYLRWSDGGTNKTISKIHFVPQLVAPLAPASTIVATLKAGLQGVLASVSAKRGNGTYLNSGTMDASTLVSGTPASVTMTSGTQQWSDGDLVAVTFEYDPWTSGSFEFQSYQRPSDSVQLPSCTLNTISQPDIPCILLEAGDGAFGVLDGAGYGVSAAVTTFVSGDSYNEYGNRIVPPAPIVVDGIWARHSIASFSTNTFYIGIYDSNGDVVSERAIASNEYASDTGEYRTHTYKLTTPVTLDAGQVYFVTFRSGDATNAVGLEKINIGTAGFGAAMPGGTGCYAVKRGGGTGAFTTDSASAHFSIGVKISEFLGSGSWVPGSGTTGNTLKVLVDPAAVAATNISGVVFAAPAGGEITGAKIGEFSGESVEADLEGGQAVLKVPVADFGGTGLLLTDTPVVLFRNTDYTTGLISATVINE